MKWTLLGWGILAALVGAVLLAGGVGRGTAPLVLEVEADAARPDPRRVTTHVRGLPGHLGPATTSALATPVAVGPSEGPHVVDRGQDRVDSADASATPAAVGPSEDPHIAGTGRDRVDSADASGAITTGAENAGAAPGAGLQHADGPALESLGDLRAADNGGNPNAAVGAFAVNTHLYARESNLDLRAFKANVDELARLGSDRLVWIRFAIDDVDAFPRTDGDAYSIDCDPASPVNCNPANLAVYDEAVDYARSRGFHVFLVTNVPSWAKVYSDPINPWEARYSLEEYKQITADYYRILATRYAGKVGIWQLFNEANILTFDAYTRFTLNDDYLRILREVIGRARHTIASIDPHALITTNAGGWPYDASVHEQWKRYFDALHTNFDMVSLDIYPDKDRSAIDALTGRIAEMESRYSKPVAIAETGMCTDGGRFTEADQAAYVPLYIERFTEANAAIVAIYELQDNTELSGACEQSFGLRTADGTKKSSYDAIISKLRT